MNPRPIVVGVAGAGSGDLAVDWAAAEAHRRGLPLRIVHVLEWFPTSAAPGDGSLVERVWSVAETVTAAAADRARAVAPELAIRRDILIGHPTIRLLELAARAELLVVGCRGRGGYAGLRLGSVSQRVVARAPGPVAVVCAPAHSGAPPEVIMGGQRRDALAVSST